MKPDLKIAKPQMTASEFLDHLTDLFIETSSHLTTEELEADLQEMGIDTEKLVQRVMKLVKGYTKCEKKKNI